MKKFVMSFTLLALLSCKDYTVKPINGTEVTETQEPAATTNATTENINEEERTEKAVTDLQNEIEKSTPENRKALLDNYLQYGPKMDGAVAESYSQFAFEYEQKHTADFYSVLSAVDTAFIKQWAEEAASEIAIQVETEADAEAFFQDLKHTNEAKTAGLNDIQKSLFSQYHKQLEETAYTFIRN